MRTIVIGMLCGQGWIDCAGPVKIAPAQGTMSVDLRAAVSVDRTLAGGGDTGAYGSSGRCSVGSRAAKGFDRARDRAQWSFGVGWIAVSAPKETRERPHATESLVAPRQFCAPGPSAPPCPSSARNFSTTIHWTRSPASNKPQLRSPWLRVLTECAAGKAHRPKEGLMRRRDWSARSPTSFDDLDVLAHAQGSDPGRYFCWGEH